MFWVIAFMSLMVFVTIAAGTYSQFAPAQAIAEQEQRALRWLKGMLGVNALSFIGGLFVLLLLVLQSVMAAPEAGEAAREISLGMGLAFIGIGIPTAGATLGAGLAVGPIGSAALAVVAEKPEVFGRSLIFIGLAEGIAIYGLVVTILMLDKV